MFFLFPLFYLPKFVFYNLTKQINTMKSIIIYNCGQSRFNFAMIIEATEVKDMAGKKKGGKKGKKSGKKGVKK